MAYGQVQEGDPFLVHVRREGGGSENLVLKFECRDGLGVVGIRKPGRTDPQPTLVGEEGGIEPASLRAGRFVHVLASGQRQSYALSRISPEVAARLPDSRWVELEPQSEYGFRYLVVPELELVASPQPAEPQAPAAVGRPAVPRGPEEAPASSVALPPPQTPMAPALAEAALRGLSREQAVDALRSEMAKVHALHARIAELEEALGRSRARERDLLDLMARWQS